MKEHGETPEYEAKSHSKKFLKAAASKKMPFKKRPGASVASPMKSPFAKGMK